LLSVSSPYVKVETTLNVDTQVIDGPSWRRLQARPM
jgi:hypothetical protein